MDAQKIVKKTILDKINGMSKNEMIERYKQATGFYFNEVYYITMTDEELKTALYGVIYQEMIFNGEIK